MVRAMSAARWSLLLSPLLSLLACVDAVPLCSRIACERPRVCEESTGRCLVPAGFDAGARVVDAGVDCQPACSASTVCDRTVGRCVQCLTSTQCDCPTPVCANNVCVADEDAGLVTPADTCSGAPQVLACAARTFDVASVNLAVVGQQLQTSCASPDAGGGDAVFGVTLGVPSNLRVTVTPQAGRSQPVVALRTTCGVDVDLDCVDSGGISGVAQFKRLPRGQYTVVLQGYDRAGSGLASARVEVLPPAGSTNEKCSLAAPLADAGATIVDLVGADDDVSLSCNGVTGSPDLFYRLSLPQASDVVVNAIGTAPLRPVLALWGGGCRGPAQFGCVAASTTSGRLTAPRLPPGEYTLVVEAPGPVTQGRVELTAQITPATPPPSNDGCGAPRELSFSNNTAQLADDTTFATDDTNTSCGGMGAPDLVYRFTVTTPGEYTFTATPEAGSGGVPVLSLRAGMCTANVTQCQAASGPNQPATLTATLPAGTWYLWLDSTQPSTAGPVRLVATRR